MADNRRFRDGMLAGLMLAAEMARAEQDSPTFNDSGEEFWKPYGEFADSLVETARAIESATK